MDQDLTLIEGTEVGRLRIAETDDAEELAVNGIGHGYGVRKLLGGVHAVAVACGH